MKHAFVFAAMLAAGLLIPAPVPAQNQPAQGQASRPAGPGTAAYIEGVQAIGGGNLAAAIQSLSRAIQAEDSNPDYLRARGVAHTLAENFPAAIADLNRAVRLRAEDREARLWLAAAYRMGGDPAKGSQFFTMSNLPPDYANMIYNDMSMEYWQSRYQGSYYDKVQRRQVQVSQPVKRLFPDAARAFAKRNEVAGTGATAAVTERVQSGLQRGDFGGALRDLQMLRRTRPDDLELRGKWAQALLGAGDALHARAEFTHVLSILPFWADGYLGRAQAAAVLGDARRANADLQVAASLKADAAAAKAKIGPRLSQLPADGAIGRFNDAARADAQFPALVDAALGAQRWANNRRHRYDEMYQDRVRVLSEAARDDGRNVDRHEMLARFLHGFHIVPVMWNGPRATQQLRPQSASEKQGELGRALRSADAALNVDPNSPNALATRGFILYTLNRSGDAEAMADKGLKIEPQNVRLLRLKTQILRDTAQQMRTRANALRTPRVERSREYRSDGVYEVTRTYPPTAEMLAEAAMLDAKAAELEKLAQTHRATADRVENEVIPGLIKRADDAFAANDIAGAARALQQAYAYQCDRAELYPRLAELAKRRGDARNQLVFTLLADPMRESTAAPALKTAWDAVLRTDWAGAETALGQGAERDPVDARIAAYRSIIAANRVRDAAAARRERRAALALEEARARLMGTSYLAAPANAPDMIDLQESGLQLVLRVQGGDAEIAARAYPQALEAYAGVLSFQKRFDKEALVVPIPTAMLPDPAASKGDNPEAPTLAVMLSLARLGNSQALLATGRIAEAQREFATVREFLATWPATQPKPGSMLLADSRARLGQAEAAYAAKNYNEAFRILTYDGWPAVPEEMRARIKQLQAEAQAARQRQ